MIFYNVRICKYSFLHFSVVRKSLATKFLVFMCVPHLVEIVSIMKIQGQAEKGRERCLLVWLGLIMLFSALWINLQLCVFLDYYIFWHEAEWINKIEERVICRITNYFLNSYIWESTLINCILTGTIAMHPFSRDFSHFQTPDVPLRIQFHHHRNHMKNIKYW